MSGIWFCVSASVFSCRRVRRSLVHEDCWRPTPYPLATPPAQVCGSATQDPSAAALAVWSVTELVAVGLDTAKAVQAARAPHVWPGTILPKHQPVYASCSRARAGCARERRAATDPPARCAPFPQWLHCAGRLPAPLLSGRKMLHSFPVCVLLASSLNIHAAETIMATLFKACSLRVRKYNARARPWSACTVCTQT